MLSLALRVGTDLPGLPDAVARTADWLTAHRTDDPSGPNWPNAVSLPERLGRQRPGRAREVGLVLRRTWRGRRPPAGRRRPWGTAHHDLAAAALSAALARPAEVAAG